MIRKVISALSLIFILSTIVLIAILTTTGIETDRFNNLISKKINQTKNIQLQLKEINFKLDLSELSLFLETKDPKINYNTMLIPTENIKVYVDFVSLLKIDLKIKKIHLLLDELDMNQIKNLSKLIKPSNFKSFLNNKTIKGKLNSEIEIFFNNEGFLKNYIVKGQVKDFKTNIFEDFNLSKTNFSFFADKEDILIKNIFGNIETVKILNGDIKITLIDGLKLKSNFNSQVNLNSLDLKKYIKLFKKNEYINNIKFLNGNLSNNISLDFDKTYKLKDYNFDLSGKLIKSLLELKTPIKSNLISNIIKEIHITNSNINLNFSPKNIQLTSNGSYSFDNQDFYKFNITNNYINNQLNLSTSFDLKNIFDLSLINYKKPENAVANISLNLKKKENTIIIKNFDFIEKNNSIRLKDLIIKNKNFSSFKYLKVKTFNNDFFINWDKKIIINGENFDAINIPRYLNNQTGDNKLIDINKEIEINFKSIKAPLSEKIKDFRLIGKIEKGKFSKISSKGDFGGNNFLDISLKKDDRSEKKILEIYSDLTRPLLTEYSFFNGLAGGNLLFTSLIDDTQSYSKIKIENFKVINAPGVIKLLSLADLGGLEDLAKGEGISFDILEIDIEKNKNFLKVNEILAIGPSMSVIMEGYQDSNGITSLRGTLVPAKTLNNIISKIPVLGKIVIPKEAGEGLFGISFKMKGPKNKIKTTINPIRTLTPRFIQKIVDKNKVSK